MSKPSFVDVIYIASTPEKESYLESGRGMISPWYRDAAAQTVGAAR
jgi:hypothetical protein